MTRKQVIGMMMQMTSSSFPKAENHFKFLVKKKLLPELKGSGSTIAAQKTTTKRAQMTTAGQMRWHLLIESVWQEQKQLNLPATEYAELQAHFMLNVDETCVMANEGTIRIIGDKDKKKT